MAEMVEVIYALPDCQVLQRVEWQSGLTVRRAIEQSGLLARFREIDLEQGKVGVFGRVCRLDRKLKPGDRVEIYRPLAIDPKEARRLRVS